MKESKQGSKFLALYLEYADRWDCTEGFSVAHGFKDNLGIFGLHFKDDWMI